MKVLSGVQPTGQLHIGNYFGAIAQWINFINQKDIQAIFMIADLHAMTIYQDPQTLRNKTYEMFALYLAFGLDYKKHTIFVQSDNPDHTYLAWLFDTITPFGWMERMTQFKDKRQKLQNYGDVVSVGLFNYPALMAADILLYNVDMVPVGEDQIQHVELTRDIAKRFNKLYGETFVVPKYKVNKVVARVMDLQNPTKKMSKSDKMGKGKILLEDSPDVIRDKVKHAVTDAESAIHYDKEKKPGVSNLLGLLSVATNRSVEDLEQEYRGKNYSTLKQDLADALIAVLTPIQKKRAEFLADRAELGKILKVGQEKSQKLSNPVLKEVLSKMGIYKYGKK